MNPDFAKGDGLVPAIVQHTRTGEVLMLGYMDEAALANTRETGLVTFFSRSKQRLWTKGHPRTLTKRHVPVSIVVGEPLYPQRRDDQAEALITLRKRMQALLDRAQAGYPEKPAGPDDAWWQPAHLGGTAPAPESAEGRDGDD